LTRLWEELLGVTPIGVDDDFFELGGHSLLALRLFAQIGEVFDRDLPVTSLFDGATIADLARLLRQPASVHGAPSSLVAIQPRGSKRPFFCVHEFFGDVLLYRNLARHLGEDRPFYALQARGLDDAEQPFTRIEDMAAHYVDAVQTVQSEGPYLLGGLCSGGIVAYEMAQLLRAQGHAAGLVALLDAPSVKSAKLRRSIRNVAQGVPDWAQGLGELTDDQRRELIRLKIAMARSRLKRSLAGLAQSFRSTATHRQPSASRGRRPFQEVADLLQFSEQHRKVAEAQSQAIRAYVPRVYPGRVTLFRARLQPIFRPQARDMGWRTLALGGVDVKVVPGNHSGMLQEPHVRVLAQELSAYLEGDGGA
jgi:thioesterase domain-containing protein